MIPRFARKTITLGGVVRTFIREKTIMAAGKEKERLNLNSEIDGIGCDCPESPRVLSIQSHVVSGYVGNKSAVFPLQVNESPLRASKSRFLISYCAETKPIVGMGNEGHFGT